MKLTSRSAMESRACARHAYNLYHAGGKGYVLGKVSPVDLFTGTLCHGGVERLWLGKSEDDTVGEVREMLAANPDQLVKSNGAPFEFRDDIGALVELLIRVFSRRVLYNMLHEYKILSVEKERPVLLVDDIVLETKTDALLELTDVWGTDAGKKAVFSLKTCSKYEPWYALRDRIALQNYTEPWAYDAEGIQMCYLIKGKKGEEFPFQGNSLLYPWYKNGIYAWSWNYTDPNGRPSTLGSTWEKVRIWERMSISSWLEYIEEKNTADNRLPVHSPWPWNRVLEVPVLSMRHKEEINSVIESLKRQESDWWKRVEAVDENDPVSLEKYFPKEYTACASPRGTCPYYNTCLYNLPIEGFPQMGYVQRTPHHALAEFDADTI